MEALKNAMKEEGFDAEEVEKAKDALEAYVQSRRRTILPRQRKVHKASQFDHIGNEEAVNAIENLFQTGGDLSPYRSKGYKSLKEDRMLDYYGVHHLHLGKELEKTGFVKRTNHLLIVFVQENNAYFLKVSPHEEEPISIWYRTEIIKIIHDNWPELRQQLSMKGISEVKPERDDLFVKETRNTNLISMHQMPDGTVYMPHGKTLEILAMIDRDKWRKSLRRAEEEIRDKIDEIAQNARKLGYHFEKEVSIKLEKINIWQTPQGRCGMEFLDLEETQTGYKFRYELKS